MEKNKESEEIDVFLALLLLFTPAKALASSFELESSLAKHHVTADRTLYHSNEKVYEAFGHVVMSSQGQRLSADYAWIDTQKRELRAKGNVIFVDKTTTVQAAEIHFNLDTGIGAIFYGKVSNDLYSLKGQLIRKISPTRFLTTEGEYTTCKDCAESWKLSARNVDLTVDGYAFMDNVYVKIKDIPTLFIPYLVVPVKTRRQSGFLFPRMGTAQSHGFTYVQPFFVAIDDHQDMTLGFGKYAERGLRYEFEYRYKSYNGIDGSLNYFHTEDRNFQGDHKYRQAIKTTNEWPFHKRFNMRWRLLEVGDRDYPVNFPDDIVGAQLSSLESSAIATVPFSDFFISAEVKRFRNLLYDQLTGFDGGMVQALPSVYFGVKERRLMGPLLGSFSGRYDHFARHNGPFTDINNNSIYDSNIDTLRESQRFLLTPELSAPFRLGPYLSLGPSLQYNELRYSFRLPTVNQNVSNTSKRYLVARLEASTVLERVYEYDGLKISRLKHQMIPFASYSNIPWIDEDKTHPFQNQLTRVDGLFDQFDVIPVTNSTNFLRLPLGNSVYYGFTSRIIRKLRTPAETPKVYPYDLVAARPKKYPAPENRKMELALDREKLWDAHNPRYSDYQDIWNLSISQAYDFKEASRQVDKKRAFSFLQAKSNLGLDDFSNTIEYRFFPRIIKAPSVIGQNPEIFKNKHSFTTNTTWYLKNLKNVRGTHSFVRSISFSFTNTSQPTPSRTISGDINWALNDFLSVRYAHSVNLVTKERISRSVSTTFTSPSECWQLGLQYSQTQSSGSKFRFDLGVNLMGYGFVGVNQFGQPGGANPGVFGGG